MKYDWRPLIDLAREQGYLTEAEHASAVRMWCAPPPMDQALYESLLAQGYSAEHARARAAARAARSTA